MNLFRKPSIRGKLMLIVMVTSGTALLLACGIFLSYDLHVFRQSKQSQLAAIADAVGTNSTGSLTFNDSDSATRTLQTMRARPHVIAAAIYDAKGRRFASYVREGADSRAVFPENPIGESHFSKTELYIYRPIWLDGQKAGTVYVQSDLADIRDRLRRYAETVSLVMLGCLLIVYVMAGLLQKAVSKPIQELSSAMESVASEKSGFLRAVKHGDDELGRLADGFNRMLQQIELREEDLREARTTLEKRVEERTRELKEEIMERRRAEQALGQSEETTRLLLDSTAEAIYGVSVTGECTFANPSCLRMLAYDDAEELLGKNMHALMHHTRADGTLYPVTECKLREAFRLGVDRHVDDEIFWRRDGTSFPAEYWSHPVIRGKQIVGAVVTFSDITERRRTEKELEQRTSFLNTLIEVSPLAIVVEDLTSRIQLCNPAFEKLFGYTRKELREYSLDNLVSTPEMRAEAEALTRQVHSGDAVHKIAQRRRKDGSLVDVEIHGVPLCVSGTLTGQFALYQDITERKKGEKELQEAKEAAESANRAKSEFLANMSHEIRTPLNAVLGMTELVLDTDLNADQRDSLGLVRSSAEALLGIINDILDFAKIEARHLELEHVPFQLREILGDTLKTLAVRAHQKGLELSLDVSPEVPEEFVGDPVRLRQVIVNLVGNGIKFTETGEVVVRVTGNSLNVDETELQFAVTDTGVGVLKEMHTKIFEAFSQADSSTTRKYGGTGLGLSITAQLVNLMGGGIRVESEPGQGSTFHFTVKLQVGHDPKRKPPLPFPEVLRGVSVLVVDDNATNRRILERMLKCWGMRPILADGGAAALAEIARAQTASETIPIALLDGHMPGMDGFALAKRIRQEPGFEATLLMMLTSGGYTEDVARCHALGISLYLIKPIEQKLLLESLLHLMERSCTGEAIPRRSESPPNFSIPKGLQFLLAEDNAVNQKLAVRLLERHSNRVVVAANGREALEALSRQSFDAVLMDVQMPQMGGLEAASLIREREKYLGGHIPIIAMTAHAMKGDREKCLNAGMDGYIAKPIRPNEFFEEIMKHMKTANQAEKSSLPITAKEPDGPVLDTADLLDRVSGDAEFLAELVSVFRADYPQQLQALRESITGGDAKKVERAAHCLKGALANLAAVRARGVAAKLEHMGRSGDLQGAMEESASLEREVTSAEQALAELCREVVG
jgi:two-component system, sensor histidine kinase and response regulator